MNSWSIARRLLWTLTLSLTVSWLLAVSACALVLYHEISEVMDSSLEKTAQRVLPLAIRYLAVQDAAGKGQSEAMSKVFEDGDDDDDDDEQEEYLIYQVRAASGRVMLASKYAPAEPVDVPLRRGHAISNGRRFFTQPSARGDLFVHIGEPVSHRVEALTESLLALLAPLLVLVPLAFAAIRWAVRRTVEPIARLREEIALRGGADLTPIAVTALPDELAPVVHDVNHLLERLEGGIEAERSFTANSAHELRTPVAAALAQAQRLSVELLGMPQRKHSEAIAVALGRLGKLVEKLLQLARAESGMVGAREPQDVLPALRIVVDEFARRSDYTGRIQFDAGTAPCLDWRIDPEAFAIAIRNLLENALVHGAHDGTVDVAVIDDTVIIRNSGPAVAPEFLATLKQRFTSGASPSRGTGLGLSIADSILRQAGGSLELRSPASGRSGGFEAVARSDVLAA